MLAGMTSPSGGTATINGYDIVTGMSAIRKRLGLCPQQNVLIGDFTVKEHLEFFCKVSSHTDTFIAVIIK